MREDERDRTNEREGKQEEEKKDEKKVCQFNTLQKGKRQPQKIHVNTTVSVVPCGKRARPSAPVTSTVACCGLLRLTRTMPRYKIPLLTPASKTATSRWGSYSNSAPPIRRCRGRIPPGAWTVAGATVGTGVASGAGPQNRSSLPEEGAGARSVGTSMAARRV
jgi:hypothetical protein